MNTLSKCVVDASVGIKLFVHEELSDTAEAFFSMLAANSNSRAYVPDLFFAECANVLWKYANRFGYPHSNAQKNLLNLYDLGVTPIPLPDIAPAALSIALKWTVSVYDACYLSTAELVNAPLVTADERLIKRLEGSKHRVHYLGELAR